MAHRKKPPADPRGGHSRIYWALQDSMAWRALSFSAVALYVAMRRKLLSTNNGNVEATLSTLRHAGFKAPATLAKGLRELQAVGLIAKTRQGGVAMGRKECNLFRFTDEQVYAHPKLGIEACPATNEWQQHGTLAEAEMAIKAAHDAVLGTRAKNASGLQNLYRASTKTVSKAKFIDTDSVPDSAPLEQKLFQSGKRKSARSPHAA